MAGYLGTKAVLLSTTAADVVGNAEIGGNLTVGGSFTSQGIDDNASATAMTLDASGNVGIGTSSPSAGSVGGTVVHVQSSGATASVRVDRSDAATAGTLSMTSGNTTVGLYGTGAKPMAFYTDSTERMRIDSSGNVGIGTTSANYPLRVEGDVGATGSIYVGSTFSAATPDYSFIADSSLGMFRLPNVLGFSVAGSEAMRINSAGSLLLGTTVNNATLTIQGNSGTSYTGYLVGSASGSGYNLLCRGYTTTGVAVRFLNSAGSDVGSIDYTTTATSYTTSSDYRLKEDVQPMVGASDRVLALNPVNFAWKADGSRVDGFLAHEAQEVVPEAVRGTKDAMITEEYEVTPAVYEDVVIPAVLDEEGNELEAERTEQRLVSEAVMVTRSVPDYQGIDQSKLVPLLTAALQEALTEIADLKARVTALEAV